MTLDLSAYPQCAKRLHFQRCRMDDKGFNAFWAAACVAEDFTDEDLTEFGGFDFDTKTEENGYRQLGRLEQFMAHRRAVAKQNENSPAFLAKQKVRFAFDKASFDRLKAFLGAYGLKPSTMQTDDDYWLCAMTLWPSITRSEGWDIGFILSQIEKMAKKERSRIARENYHKVPREFQANGKGAAA